MAKYDKVNLEEYLRADADGMPIFRRCFDHEILMSFINDLGAEAFDSWWYEEGAELFNNWLKDHPDFHTEYCKPFYK